MSASVTDLWIGVTTSPSLVYTDGRPTKEFQPRWVRRTCVKKATPAGRRALPPKPLKELNTTTQKTPTALRLGPCTRYTATLGYHNPQWIVYGRLHNPTDGKLHNHRSSPALNSSTDAIREFIHVLKKGLARNHRLGRTTLVSSPVYLECRLNMGIPAQKYVPTCEQVLRCRAFTSRSVPFLA